MVYYLFLPCYLFTNKQPAHTHTHSVCMCACVYQIIDKFVQTCSFYYYKNTRFELYALLARR